MDHMDLTEGLFAKSREMEQFLDEYQHEAASSLSKRALIPFATNPMMQVVGKSSLLNLDLFVMVLTLGLLLYATWQVYKHINQRCDLYQVLREPNRVNFETGPVTCNHVHIFP